jgi:hypothetical protein
MRAAKLVPSEPWTSNQAVFYSHSFLSFAERCIVFFFPMEHIYPNKGAATCSIQHTFSLPRTCICSKADVLTSVTATSNLYLLSLHIVSLYNILICRRAPSNLLKPQCSIVQELWATKWRRWTTAFARRPGWLILPKRYTTNMPTKALSTGVFLANLAVLTMD